jgi:hypothetical protein
MLVPIPSDCHDHIVNATGPHSRCYSSRRGLHLQPRRPLGSCRYLAMTIILANFHAIKTHVHALLVVFADVLRSYLKLVCTLVDTFGDPLLKRVAHVQDGGCILCLRE